MSTPTSPTRTRLMEQHIEARRKRDAAALDSEEFRSASEEIARIEIAIATAEEPAPKAAEEQAPKAAVPA